MRNDDMLQRCQAKLEQALLNRQLYVRASYLCKAQSWFVSTAKIHTGITISTIEGESGPITRTWGILFIEADKPLRCTEIHSSFYGESVALRKLLQEIEKTLVGNFS
jgi:hypothetical protein